jgi:hypothetical protein
LQAQFAAGGHFVWDIKNIFTIRLITKQSFKNLRLFCLFFTGIETNLIFFTLFLVFFHEVKQNKSIKTKTREFISWHDSNALMN